MFKYAEIADIVYFWFASNTATGEAGDGASPTYVVRKAGEAANAAKKSSGTPTLLTHADYSAGSYEIAIDTAGWSAGEYAVFCTLLISAVNPNGFVGSFKLRTAGTGALDVTLSNASLDDIADEPYDNDGADISLREAIRIMLSVLSGLSTGGGTNTISFRDLLNTKNRVRMTVDANGNRTVTITRDGT